MAIETWKAKLHPRRYPGMSGKMAAIVGAITGERYTEPALAELTITSDGVALARAEDDCGCNEWIGSAADLERNWQNLLSAAGLSESESRQAESAYAGAVTDWRRVPVVA
jgi:hypothetical protein